MIFFLNIFFRTRMMFFFEHGLNGFNGFLSTDRHPYYPLDPWSTIIRVLFFEHGLNGLNGFLPPAGIRIIR